MTNEQARQDIKETLLSIYNFNDFQTRVNSIISVVFADALQLTLEHYNCDTVHDLQIYDSKITEMDCGWLLWTFDDKKLNDHVEALRKAQGVHGSQVRLDTPTPVQSVNIQGFAANLIKDSLKDVLPLKFVKHYD